MTYRSSSGSVDFRLNADFEHKVLTDQALVAWLTPLTDNVADAARRLVPKRLHHLEQSIESVVLLNTATRRMIGRVFATDFKARWHEFGTRKMAASPFLFPALVETVPGASITRGGSS